MKKNKVLIAVLAVMAAASSVRAETGISFDGKTGETRRGGYNIDLKALIEANTRDIAGSVIPFPVNDAVESPTAEQNFNRSIRHSIEYCEHNSVSPAITENLKKLLFRGTPVEKSAYFESQKYVFPTRFRGLEISGVPDPSKAITKGYQQNCWEEKKNCRMEQVCGQKEIRENLCDLTCGPITLTGILLENVPLAAGGYVCDKACYWAARYVKDCANIEKCDIINHCDTIWVNDDADPVNPNTGGGTHQ